MEIAIVSAASIRIKGKLATLVVDPSLAKTKVTADATLILKRDSAEGGEVEGSRLTMSGPGEYEVGGVKITGVKGGDCTAYYLSLDGISLLVTPVSSLKGKESLRDVDIVILLADALADPSALATVTSGVAVFYGPQAEENVKALGKEVQKVEKYSIAREKLPQEMEVILLA